MSLFDDNQLLQKINLYHNKLTGNLKYLFGGQDHLGFPSLQELGLKKTQLDKMDIEALSKAVKQKKLPQLQKLDLSWTKLTGSLKHLFGGEDHPGFLSLQELVLPSTKLHAADLEALGEVVRESKLPQLQKMDLSFNNFQNMEQEVQDLVHSLIHQERHIGLHLFNTGVSDQWKTKIEVLCKDSEVDLNWDQWSSP